jgi:N-acetyl-gamma-glutamyl-phosphate reductase
MQFIKTAIVGASGYTGSELVRLLLQHPSVEITAVTSRQEVGRRIDDLFPRFRKTNGADLKFIEPDRFWLFPTVLPQRSLKLY